MTMKKSAKFVGTNLRYTREGGLKIRYIKVSWYSCLIYIIVVVLTVFTSSTFQTVGICFGKLVETGFMETGTINHRARVRAFDCLKSRYIK